MKIKESNNLKYDNAPWRGPDEGYEKFNPEQCLLESFDRAGSKIVFYFKNRSQAVIKAKDFDGEKELDLVYGRLNDFLDKNYDEILNNDF